MNPYNFDGHNNIAAHSRFSRFVSRSMVWLAHLLSATIGLLTPTFVIVFLLKGWPGCREWLETIVYLGYVPFLGYVPLIVLAVVIFQVGSVFVGYRDLADRLACSFSANLFAVPVGLVLAVSVNALGGSLDDAPRFLTPIFSAAISLSAQHLILANRQRKKQSENSNYS